jgi:four helix bundle protein
MSIVNFKDLIVWQKSMDLVEIIYQLTKLLPADERFGLIDQMRRASTSIPSNIAEGYCRNSKKDYLKFIHYSYASAAELETQIELCVRLKFITNDQAYTCRSLLTEVQKILNTFRTKLKN